MPSWSIHLSVAKKVTNIIDFKDNKDLFYYGSLIPDVDKGTSVKRYDAHFYGTLNWDECLKENKIEIDRFLENYKNNFDNALILGYYAHLLTDNFYNKIVYSNCWVQDDNHNIIGIKLKNGKIKNIPIDDPNREKRTYKHYDFELYGKTIFNDDLIIPMNYEKIVLNSKCLKPQFLTEDLIKYRINYLNSNFKKFNKLSLKEKIFKNRYKLFTKEELDKMLDDCSNYVVSEIRKIS